MSFLTFRFSLLSSSVLACLAASAPALAGDGADPALLDVITVTGQRTSSPALDTVAPEFAPPAGADAAGLVARLPGAALIDNGSLSGQVQYRGLFGPRVAVRVDGQSFSSGGPNLMDPPLHYAPMPLISRIEVDRGVSPVRSGPGLAGGVNAVFKRIDFSDDQKLEPHYDVTAIGRSVDDSYSVGGVAGVSNDTFRFNALASYEKGESIEYPDGEIADTSHERLVYGGSLGFRQGAHEFGFDLRRQETDPTGNPPFAMDIRYFDTNFMRATYAADLGSVRFDAAFGYADVSHAMNNFDLRPAPADMTRYRETFAKAETFTGEAGLSFNFGDGVLRIGGDYEDANKNVRITNPNNANFFIESLPDVDMRRYGLFGEWNGQALGWNAELGVRADWHEAEAGAATLGSALPMGPQMLAMTFNAADRRWDATTVDAVVRLWRETEGPLTWRVTLARKTRAPGYVERFSWLPTEASAGLADGNTYVGDLNLKPEVAWIAEAGVDWWTDNFYARPTVFYRRIDDYIQGVPYDATPDVVDSMVEMVSSMNGDASPLRFANVDARLYGVDVDFGARLVGPLRADGVISYVRGERRDIDDNLYRIAPPRMNIGLTWEGDAWSATFESVLAAKQDKVSATNSEAVTDGFAVFNLFGDLTIADGVALSAGVENLFDERYEEHLAGYNRVMGSDVALGARLPGSGRGAFVRIRLSR
ncbi:MAG: TonB-dependent receptor [Caulobacterales bacterium]|nr:TonB-dependent receptor [Caulobacterales bacterium]